MGACFLWACGCARDREEESRALTIQDVLKLHRAGVDPDVIVAGIRASDTRGRLSVDGIIALREMELPAKVLEALVAAAAADPSTEVRRVYVPSPYDPMYPGYPRRGRL